MAISVDWPSRVITVPKDDLVLIQASPEVRQLDLDTFRLELKSLEDDVEGMVHPDTHRNIAPITVGGVNLARVVELINNYTVTFEPGAYRVDVVGGNTNLLDVTNYTSAQVATSNSGGLVESGASGDCGLTDTERQMLIELHSSRQKIDELHNLAGLGTVSTTIPSGAGTITGDGIEIDVTGDCETGHTLTRRT